MNLQKVKLDHLNLTVDSFRASVEWYGAMFGFEVVEEGIDEDERPWGVLRSGDSMLCIYEDETRKMLPKGHPDADGLHRIYHFGLRITDRDHLEAMLREREIPTFHGSPVHYAHSTSWYVKDPTGHMIEVVLWNGDSVAFG